MADYCCHVPAFHLSLKQNLQFFVREKEVNLMGKKNIDFLLQSDIECVCVHYDDLVNENM